MKIIQSSLFRALCAIVIGVLLIKYREQTVTWITITIGVLFFLSGVISLVSYLVALRNKSDVQLFDADGNQISGKKPTFPLVSVGSLILGLILALMPNTFVNWLMFILAIILILGAINQFAMLATATKYGHVGFIYWIFPSVILLVALIALIRPSSIAAAPLFILGWCMVIYGVAECINLIKLRMGQKKYEQLQQPKLADSVDDDSTDNDSVDNGSTDDDSTDGELIE